MRRYLVYDMRDLSGFFLNSIKFVVFVTVLRMINILKKYKTVNRAREAREIKNLGILLCNGYDRTCGNYSDTVAVLSNVQIKFFLKYWNEETLKICSKYAKKNTLDLVLLLQSDFLTPRVPELPHVRIVSNGNVCECDPYNIKEFLWEIRNADDADIIRNEQQTELVFFDGIANHVRTQNDATVHYIAAQDHVSLVTPSPGYAELAARCAAHGVTPPPSACSVHTNRRCKLLRKVAKRMIKEQRDQRQRANP